MGKRMRSLWFFALALVICFSCESRANEELEKKIEDVLSKMTFDEKIEMLGGDDTGFNGQGVERLGIPKIMMADGPVGVRDGQATAFPVSTNLAASWDLALAKRYGVALAEETKARGKNVILGPCVCIHRFPLSGRNFESYGEDPFLTSRMAVNYIEGVQSEDVAATIKHFAANDQEWERFNVDIRVSERALREIHMPAFEYAVKEADVLAVMNSYNLVNGWYASENKHLLQEILKDEWGFSGIVMSDWGSTHSSANAANAGLDIQMPNPSWFGDKLKADVKAGLVSEDVINDKIRRHLRVRFKAGIFDNPIPTKDDSVIRSEDHISLAREMAEKSIVLLKNENVLPLDRNRVTKIAMIGPNANIARTGGGGSSMVNPWRTVSPFEGVKKLAGDKFEVKFALGTDVGLDGFKPIPAECLKTPDSKKHGLVGKYYNNKDFKGEPALVKVSPEINFSFGHGIPGLNVNVDNFSISWHGKFIPNESGTHLLGISSDDGSKLYLDGKLVIDNGGEHGDALKTAELDLVAGKEYDLKIEFFEAAGEASMRLVWKEPKLIDKDVNLEAAIALAKESDIAVVCVGNTFKREAEGSDISGFKMLGKQDELVKAVAKVNPNTVVVLSGGTAIYMGEWLDDVEAVIAAFYPGQEGGDALANILFGEVNPSAKLPFSYIQKKSDTYAFDGYMDSSLKMYYKEGVFVGYRYYDINEIDPLFEFGHGLSYTTYKYSNIKVKQNGKLDYTVTAKIKNTGKAAGEEIVQLYIAPQQQAALPRPVKELKGFVKVSLEPGESKVVEMNLDARSFQYYDDNKMDWVAEEGKYEVLVGASSRDLKLKKTIKLEL